MRCWSLRLELPNGTINLFFTVGFSLTMHTFFHGWRRNAGCILLVLACVLACLWVRSQDVLEQLCFRYPGFAIGHACGVVFVSAMPSNPNQRFVAFQWVNNYGKVVKRQGHSTAYPICVHSSGGYIAYLVLILLTTLLSAYLILWKPRKREACPN